MELVEPKPDLGTSGPSFIDPSRLEDLPPLAERPDGFNENGFNEDGQQFIPI